MSNAESMDVREVVEKLIPVFHGIINPVRESIRVLKDEMLEPVPGRIPRGQGRPLRWTSYEPDSEVALRKYFNLKLALHCLGK